MALHQLNYISNEVVRGDPVYSQTFVALPVGRRHGPFRRLDALPSAKILSAGRRVDPGKPAAADAKSEGWVSIDLPEGAILKTVSCDPRVPAFKGKTHNIMVVRNGILEPMDFEGVGRVNDGKGSLKIIVVLDGNRVLV